MTLEQRLTALVNAIGAKDKQQSNAIGVLASLNTTTKTSLVAAINEILVTIAGSTQINDAAIATTSTYSSSKIETIVDNAVAEAVNTVLGGASAAYDTLVEIQGLLQGQDNSLANLLTAVGTRLRFDAPQTLTSAQKTQACANLGIGEPDTDFVATYNAALL
ncbi:MAG: hypothetical protein LCH91_14195 [Bacteroidetes bacterium]|nr:hypothetical protein [Bacteroidota bacterium]